MEAIFEEIMGKIFQDQKMMASHKFKKCYKPQAR